MNKIPEQELLKNCPPLLSRFGIGTGHVTSSTQTVDSGISIGHAGALYDFIKKTKPKVALEVGMANGISSVAILQGLKENNFGRLISIDPFQSTHWARRGLELINECGLAGIHTLIEEPDYLALPKLLSAGSKIDFSYIDGWHTFDYALLDFWYIDKILNVNGAVAFNDCGLRSVNKVIKFLQSHRDYKEEMVLKATYTASNFPKTIARMALGLCTNDRYFIKQSEFEPAWDFFKDF